MRAERSQVALEELQGRRMGDDVDALREVDDHGALAPHQHVVRGQVAVDPVGGDHDRDLVEELAPYARGRLGIQGYLGEPRSRTVRIADERHAVAVIEQLDRRRDRDARRIEADQALPLARDPARVRGLVSEPRVVLHRAVLTLSALAPRAIEVVVLEEPPSRARKARDQHGMAAARAGDDDLTFARLQDAQVLVRLGRHEPAWREQRLARHACSLRGGPRAGTRVRGGAGQKGMGSALAEAGAAHVVHAHETGLLGVVTSSVASSYRRAPPGTGRAAANASRKRWARSGTVAAAERRLRDEQICMKS
jgi:hypothetical protein